jgi:hypothetical protein
MWLTTKPTIVLLLLVIAAAVIHHSNVISYSQPVQDVAQDTRSTNPADTALLHTRTNKG